MSRDMVPVDPAEVDTIASELTAAYRYMAAFYRDQMEMTGPAADAHARCTSSHRTRCTSSALPR